MKKILFVFLFSAFTLYAHESELRLKGKHSFASYHQCSHEALHDSNGLREAFLTAIEASGAHTLSYTEHVFEDGAYTLVILLSESHATLHTYPELKSCFVDLFTFGEHCKAQPFHHVLIEYLDPGLSNLNLIERS